MRSPPTTVVAIIEDDPSFRRALRRLLGLRGFRAEAFASAEEFLQRAGAEEVDCIVLDVYLGGMNGLELQAKLALTAADVPIIFITAFDDPVTRQRALEGGAAGYLQKPFDDTSLLDAIARAIARGTRTRGTRGPPPSEP